MNTLRPLCIHIKKFQYSVLLCPCPVLSMTKSIQVRFAEYLEKRFSLWRGVHIALIGRGPLPPWMGLIAPIIMGGAPSQVLLTVLPRDKTNIQRTSQIISISYEKWSQILQILMMLRESRRHEEKCWS